MTLISSYIPVKFVLKGWNDGKVYLSVLSSAGSAQSLIAHARYDAIVSLRILIIGKIKEYT